MKRLQGIKKMEASTTVALEIYGKGVKHSFKAKCIREWSDEYANNLCFSETKQGKHSKVHSVITDPAVQEIMRSQMLELPDIERTPARFRKLLNDDLLSKIPDAPMTVSKETARRWYNILGLSSGEHTSKKKAISG